MPAQSWVRGFLKIPECGCVVLDQPQHPAMFQPLGHGCAGCGWSATQPRFVGIFIRFYLCPSVFELLKPL
jgi:hypothetical protein